MPKSSDAIEKSEDNNEMVPITGEQPKRSPYANPVRHDTIYFGSANAADNTKMYEIINFIDKPS